MKCAQKRLARASEFKIIFESFLKDHPGETSKQIRFRVHEWLNGAAMDLAVHFLKCNEETKARYEAIHAQFLREADKQAEDPSYVPELTGQFLKGDKARPNARS